MADFNSEHSADCSGDFVTCLGEILVTLGFLTKDELIMALEGEFGIQIPYEEAEKIITVQSAIDYMANIVGENV